MRRFIALLGALAIMVGSGCMGVREHQGLAEVLEQRRLPISEMEAPRSHDRAFDDRFDVAQTDQHLDPVPLGGPRAASYQDDVPPPRSDNVGDAPLQQLAPESLDETERSIAGRPLTLLEVVESVHATFPLLEAAYLQENVASGNQIAAWGSFDTKLKSATQSAPTGFYETYRNSVGLARPIYDGGEVFGGYRLGRGIYEPWYLERETNDGGEFKAGVRVPLLRNRDIDSRRAELWRATYEQQRVRPAIRAQLIMFVRDASIAYWQWVAAGQQLKIGEEILRLTVERNEQLGRRVEEGNLAPPVLQDNLRAIAQREARVIERRRKLEQASVKLSLFYRTPDGSPVVPTQEQLDEFRQPLEINPEDLDSDIALALERSPILEIYEAERQKLQVTLAEAENDFLPTLDAQLIGSQDVGAPTSSKRDKSRFEVEAGLFLDVPLQRRKAVGKTQAAQGKLGQLSANRMFAEDKIVADVQAAYVNLHAAYARYDRAREAKRLALYMVEVEETEIEAGGSDLFSVLLREQAAVEAADAEVQALLEYAIALAEYNAVLAFDRPIETQTDDE